MDSNMIEKIEGVDILGKFIHIVKFYVKILLSEKATHFQSTKGEYIKSQFKMARFIIQQHFEN